MELTTNHVGKEEIMGTLFEQRPRKYHSIELDKDNDMPTYYMDMFQLFQTLSEKTKVSFKDLVYLFEVMEKRRANLLRVNDFDAKDEQLAGFGEIAKNFLVYLDFIATQIERAVDNMPHEGL